MRGSDLAVADAAHPVEPSANAIARLLATDVLEELLALVREIFARTAFAERLAYSPDEAEDDIRKWINEWNKNPRPFVWTKSADTKATAGVSDNGPLSRLRLRGDALSRCWSSSSMATARNDCSSSWR
jgi:hypothetical protein